MEKIGKYQKIDHINIEKAENGFIVNCSIKNNKPKNIDSYWEDKKYVFNDSKDKEENLESALEKVKELYRMKLK